MDDEHDAHAEHEERKASLIHALGQLEKAQTALEAVHDDAKTDPQIISHLATALDDLERVIEEA